MSKTEHDLTGAMKVTVTDRNEKRHARTWVPGVIVDVSNNDGMTPRASMWLGSSDEGTEVRAEYFQGSKRTYLTFTDGRGARITVEVEVTPEQIMDALANVIRYEPLPVPLATA